MFDIALVSDDHKDLLLFSQVQAGNITQENFEKNYALIQDNPSFEGVLRNMKSNPAMQYMYSTMLASGPEAFLQVIGMLVNSGVVDKKQVREATGLKKAPRSQKSWYKVIAEDIFPVGHKALNDAYLAGAEGWRAKYPNDTIPDTFEAFLKATGKASISSTVDNYEHPQSKKNCALALVLRVDYNCSARNGTKEEEKEETPVNGA